MDIPPYDYMPITERPDISWPGGKKLAFYVGLNIEVFEPGVPATAISNVLGLNPDPMNHAWRDYGTRVGIWRMIDLLDATRMKVSALTNSRVLSSFPQIVEAGCARNWAWVGHGETNSELWTNLDLDTEVAKLDLIIRDFERHTGSRPKGWLGPAFSETPNTLGLLAERGFQYSLDWCADDQPYPLKVAGHKFVSVPYSPEINDISAFLLWNWTPDQFAKAIWDQFECLLAEARAGNARVMAVCLHPFLVNTPFRHSPLAEVMKKISEYDEVWHANTDEIASYYIDNYYHHVPES